MVAGGSLEFQVPTQWFRGGKITLIELIVLTGASAGSGLIDQFQRQLRFAAQRVRIARLMTDPWRG